VGGRTLAALLPDVLDQLLHLELLEVAADGVGGDAKALRKLSRGKGLRALELDEDVASEAPVAGQAGSDGRHEGES
jgi:hypothetical protein